MRTFSTFSGVEGIGQGLPKECETVGFSEIDKYASQVLAYHYPHIKNYGDIGKINWSEVPDFDLLTGGSPCQDFSIAGRRRGLGGTKSSLAWEYIRALREKQPRYFLWENVKGVMSSRSGWDFANLLVAFSESGYSLWYQVLNAKDFGVPQNRERIFVFGVRGESAPEVFFEREGNQQIDQLNAPKHSNDRVYGESGISPTLNTARGGNRQPFIAVALRNKDRSKHQGKDGQKYGDYAKQYHLEPQRDGLSFAVKETAHENYILQRSRGKNKGGLHTDAPTLSSNSWVDNNHLVGGESIRRLTPIECERLMGWPDDWTRYGSEGEISDSQRYKMCGNGVVSAVVRAIIPILI